MFWRERKVEYESPSFKIKLTLLAIYAERNYVLASYFLCKMNLL